MVTFDETKDEPRRVALYIRVSTAEQRIDGYSLDAQEKRLTEHVERNVGLNLSTKKEWIYKDTHTGSDLNRVELDRLREDVKAKKCDAVLVWKIDRLSRSLKHLLTLFEELQQNKVSFISVQENIDFRGPIGQLIFQMFGAIAQFERELIKGRTQMGKIASAEAGNYTGTWIPYGYRPVPNPGGKGKKLELAPKERDVVRQMYKWYIHEEEVGDGMIADRLNEKKVPRPNWSKIKGTNEWVCEMTEGTWTTKQVTPILTNPLYRGQHIANTKDDEGNPLPEDRWTITTIPECIPEFTFLQAHEARRAKDGGGGHTDYLLAGKLKDMTLERPKALAFRRRLQLSQETV